MADTVNRGDAQRAVKLGFQEAAGRGWTVLAQDKLHRSPVRRSQHRCIVVAVPRENDGGSEDDRPAKHLRERNSLAQKDCGKHNGGQGLQR